MAVRCLQIATLNNIQFVPANNGLPIAYKQYQMGKEWFRQAQLSWQKRTNYSQKIQFQDVINIQANRTEFNDINLYIVSCSGEVLEDLTNLAQRDIGIAGNTYQGEQLYTHHFNFKFADYGLAAGTYYLRMDAVYYDGVDPIDVVSEYSEPLQLKTDHKLTAYAQYRYNVNKENVLFNIPEIIPFTFGLRFEGWIVNYQPDSADVAFQTQGYKQRVISSTPLPRKFTLQIGGKDGVPDYMIEKLNAALSCTANDGVFLLNGVRYTKADGAQLEKQELGGTYPMYAATIDLQEYDPIDAITFSRNSSFQLVEGLTYPFHVQRVDFATPFIAGVVRPTLDQKTVIENSGDLDALVTYLNTDRLPSIGLTGTAQRVGDDIFYTNGDNETYTLGFRIQNDSRLRMEVSAISAPNPFRIDLQNGYATVYWDNGVLALHEPTDGNVYSLPTTYTIDGTYTVDLWHNLVTSISIDTQGLVNPARVTDIGGQTTFRLEKFFLRGQDLSGLASGLDLSFLTAQGIPNQFLKQLGIPQNGLVGLDGTVFAANPYASNSQYWAALNVLNIGGNAFSVSEVNSFVNDYYDNTPHLGIGVMILDQTPTAVATGPALAKINLLKAALWYITP